MYFSQILTPSCKMLPAFFTHVLRFMSTVYQKITLQHKDFLEFYPNTYTLKKVDKSYALFNTIQWLWCHMFLMRGVSLMSPNKSKHAKSKYTNYLGVGALNCDQDEIVCIAGMPFGMANMDFELRLKNLLQSERWIESVLEIRRTFVWDPMQITVIVVFRLAQGARNYYRNIENLCKDFFHKAGVSGTFLTSRLQIPVYRESFQ